jgi:aspartate racemase
MRTLGIVGGLGAESTIDYYRAILARYRDRTKKPEYPRVLINSLDVDKAIAMLDAGQLGEFAQYLSEGVEQLVRAGADFGVIAANTPHLVFEEVQRQSAIPLVSIVRAAAEHAKALGLKRVGLLGTGFTMRASFYPREFERVGIVLVVPDESEREYIHRKYVDELLKNQFLAEARSGILGIALRMKTDCALEAIVLAGTELPILLRDASNAELKLLDTTLIHVEAIVDELMR